MGDHPGQVACWKNYQDQHGCSWRGLIITTMNDLVERIARTIFRQIGHKFAASTHEQSSGHTFCG